MPSQRSSQAAISFVFRRGSLARTGGKEVVSGERGDEFHSKRPERWRLLSGAFRNVDVHVVFSQSQELQKMNF
jgi:hypothetical protein